MMIYVFTTESKQVKLEISQTVKIPSVEGSLRVAYELPKKLTCGWYAKLRRILTSQDLFFVLTASLENETLKLSWPGQQSEEGLAEVGDGTAIDVKLSWTFWGWNGYSSYPDTPGCWCCCCKLWAMKMLPSVTISLKGGLSSCLTT